MGIVLDAINEELAALQRILPAPTGDIGLGSDLDCTDDLTGDMAELPDNSPRALAQANYRRLITPRGTLPDDADYGLGIEERLNVGVTANQLAELPGDIETELRKDDRNEQVDVVFRQTGASAFSIDISGQTSVGPFSLTFAVVDGEATLDAINGETL